MHASFAHHDGHGLMPPNLSQALAAALEDVIWSAPQAQLQAAAPVIMSFLEAAGCKVPALLEEMCDEALAVAVKKGFLSHLAFEELLVNRYERALLCWFYRKTGDWHL